jgi:hypothetical protein
MRMLRCSWPNAKLRRHFDGRLTVASRNNGALPLGQISDAKGALDPVVGKIDSTATDKRHIQ